MAFTTGDVWDVQIQMRNTGTNPEQCARVGWQIEALGPYIGPTAIAAAIRHAWAPMMSLVSANVFAEGVFCRMLSPGATGAVPVRFATDLQGGDGAPALPTSAACEVLRKTGGFGRQNWGRFYLPWTTEASMDVTADNQIAAGALSNILSAAQDFQTLLIAGGGGLSRWKPVVYSKGGTSGIPHWADIASFDVMTHYRSLARRGRREGGCPPFPDERLGIRFRLMGSPPNYLGTSIPVSHSGQRAECMNLSLGNGAGNAAEPAGWETQGWNYSGWRNDTAYSGSAGFLDNPRVFHQLLSACNNVLLDGVDWPIANTEPAGYVADEFVPFDIATEVFVVPNGTIPAPSIDLTARDQHVLFRNDVWVPNAPVWGAFIAVNGIDGQEVFVNGTSVYNSGIFETGYGVVAAQMLDVTALIQPNAINTIAIRQRSDYVSQVLCGQCNSAPFVHGRRNVNAPCQACIAPPPLQPPCSGGPWVTSPTARQTLAPFTSMECHVWQLPAA